MRKRWLRILGWALGVVVIVALGAFAFVYHKLDASLPLLDGELALAGLQQTVTVERDHLGVATIRAGNRMDVARATGFLHAQERFFQMDLLRRSGAGELSALFGPGAVNADKHIRIHRFRSRARGAIEAGSDTDRAILEAYTDGVNAGLAALGAKPFEYLVLGVEPEPWRMEDSSLVAFAMYFDLQDEDGARESTHGVMHDLLPEPMYAFLNPRRTEWDSPLMPGPAESPPVPGPEVFDLRGRASTPLPEGDNPEERALPGSNNFAVAGHRTAHGGAIFANDMHLGLRVPNIWYRLSIRYPAPGGEERVITGVTLPGGPLIIAGSNTHIAWGYTNSYGDWSDLVVLEETDGGYLTPDGVREFQIIEEPIAVKDADPVAFEITETIWGPVMDEDHNGRKRALNWTAHSPRAVNIGLMRLEGVTGVREALTVANTLGMPNQNFVVADSAGHIGWTLSGPIPRRFGHDGYLPTSWADGSRGWAGWLAPVEYPRIIDPPAGQIWTANNRVADGDALRVIGDGDYDAGARARQIRDGLLEMDAVVAKDMLQVQLDDRALFLSRWQQLLLDVLDEEAVSENPQRQEMRALVADWGECACVDSTGYRLVRAFRLYLAEQVFAALTGKMREVDASFNYTRWVSRYEGPLWQLADQQPPHLLNPAFDSWRSQLLAAVDQTLEYFSDQGGDLASHTWGERNTLAIQHPMSRFIPGSARWLNMPAAQLPGDWHMPRVQSPAFGPSERFAVSPGREAEGYFHMPVGQGAHPLSPWFGKGHAAWVEGETTPFLPGPTAYTLTLSPGL